MGEWELLNRAHQLFAERTVVPPPDLASTPVGRVSVGASAGAAMNSLEARDARVGAATDAATRIDRALAAVVAAAVRDHVQAQRDTGRVLEAARADQPIPTASPLAQRDAMRRKAARLRMQRKHIKVAQRRAARRRAILRALRYRVRRRGLPGDALRTAPPYSRAARAVRAALSRLGRPYVWGATGPDRFDCSGLTQWAYRQAGVQLGRTTYDQIDDGFAVTRAQVRPGDLVFPNAGHVQLAIGGGKVVEAPYSGATVQISSLGQDVVIRRPLP